MIRYITILLAAFALQVLAAPLAVPAHADAAQPREVVFENGLKVFIAEDHKAPLAIFQIWYRVGARNEVSGKTGLSHVLEHMMFKGTETYGPKVISQTVRKNGGVDNAFTSKDYTAYFQILPADRIGLSLRFESDRMRNLLLNEEEFQAERAVVKEERRWRSEDDPQSALYELVLAAAYNVHPYGRPVIGWMSDLGNLTLDDLATHYQAFYAPDNAVLIVAGDVYPDTLLPEIEKYFAALPAASKQEAARRTAYISQEPPQRGMRRVTLKKEAQLPYVLMAYRVPALPDSDAYALEVLAEILSGGKSSRLYSDMVYERKLALDVSASYSITMVDPFLFMLDATATPGNAIEDVEAALRGHLQRLKEEPPTDFELQKAKNGLESQHVMGLDSIYVQAMIIGVSEITGSNIKDSYVAGIRSVTSEDVRRAAQKYFHEDGATIGTLIPLPLNADAQSTNAIPAQSDKEAGE